MYHWVLSASAKSELKRIYAYGLSEWGEMQADKYFHAFFTAFDKIASNPFLYQSIDHIRPGYHRSSCGSDTIYYRVIKDRVEIMAILGGQDINHWL